LGLSVSHQASTERGGDLGNNLSHLDNVTEKGEKSFGVAKGPDYDLWTMQGPSG